jgi:hypothetical protein
MKPNLHQLAERFKEPSSWAGIAGIAAVVGFTMDAGLMQSAIYIAAGIAGLVAFFTPEGAK